jgi:tRNA A-37 threonylcarbamoyl transferase component Bud32
MKPGDTIEGRYRVIKQLDQGGMGTVVLAEHVLIKRRVAVKILKSDLAADADAVERFMNEARAAGTLGHPNIVESTDMGFMRNGIPYIVFEYLEGTLLVDEVYRLGGLPLRRTLKIAHQIAFGLDAAHNAGIVHRDLKSENIFLTDKDERPDHVKVLDFGISRFAEVEADSGRRSQVMGTPEFMAPEQITSPERVDRRTDIYALGVIMYEMLAARRPFKNDGDPHAVLRQVVHDPPPALARSDLPPGLPEMLFDKLLAKDPTSRYATMKDVQQALEAFYNIARPGTSITPLSIPITQLTNQVTNGVALRAATGRVATPLPLPDAPARAARKAIAAFLVVGGVAVAAGAGLLVLGGNATQTGSADPAVLASLKADADKLAGVLDAEARAVRLRADAIATTPMLRAAIETDAATINDMAESERLFSPKSNEVLEVFQFKGGQSVSMLRLPAGASPLSVAVADQARIGTDGTRVLVTVAAPVSTQGGISGGMLAIASAVDLVSVQTDLARDAGSSALLGLGKPITLTTGSGSGGSVELPIAVHDAKADGLKLAATVRDTAGAAPPATRPISYACFGLGGVMMFLYLGSLLRARREG